MKTAPCKYTEDGTTCGSTWHTKSYHTQKPRKELKTRSTLVTRKRMRRVGKVAQKTLDYVAEWKLTQKPNHEGYFVCYIGGDWIPYLTAEHPYSKTRHPDKRTNQKLETVCDPHNELKGSLDIHDFLEKHPEFKLTVKKEYLSLEG